MPSKISPPSRLGRGLSSLIKIADQPLEREVSESIKPVPANSNTLPITKIHPNPHQPRRQFNPTTLSELAESIKYAGLIQPIIVRPAEDGYELIAGERRWRAAQLAGLIEIPAIIRQVDSANQAQMALIENIQREDLNPIERAHAYQSLIDQLGLTQSELAARLGEDRSSIANFLRLLNLADAVREQVQSGHLSLGHAKLLAGIADLPEQKRLADLIIQGDLSVRSLEQLIRTGPPIQPLISHPNNQTPHLSDLEKTITTQLGLRVQLRAGSKPGRGKLIIHYADLDQFDELMSRINIELPDT